MPEYFQSPKLSKILTELHYFMSFTELSDKL